MPTSRQRNSPRPGTRAMPHWLLHALLLTLSFCMLLPFYWVLKTSLTGENIFVYPPSVLPVAPHPFYYVDTWYYIPFARYLANSVIVSGLSIAANVVFNAMAAYALTKQFKGRGLIITLLLSCMMIPFQTTIVPAYLITGKLGLLNSYLGLALPTFSTIVCIFVYKASFDAVPTSLIDSARIDGLSEFQIIMRIMMPLSASAVATNVVLTFIWSWNNFLWPLIIIRDSAMQTLPLGLSRFLSYHENTTGALYAFCIMVLLPGIVIFLMAQKEFIRGLTSGATKG
jgi:ABC-type glycerol-3-phosphate transport system permease component